jgi:GNAT superfamily N-acetyltransferase
MGIVEHLPAGRPAYAAPRPITAEDRLDGFDCGKAPLNDWLRNHARASEGKSARSYVVTQAVGSDAGRVVGYYCLANGAITQQEVPTRMRHGLPRIVPVMVMGRLAVDRAHQGARIGRGLLKEAMIRTAEASRIAGIRALIVHAIDDEALAWYSKYDFQVFPTGTRTMFLPIETIIQAL